MRVFTATLLFFSFLVAGCSPATKYPEVRDTFPAATEIRLYVESGYRDNGEPVWSKAEGVELSKAQRANFESALNFVPVPDTMTACFVPHHFFRYYNSTGEMVGEVQVCFCCLGVSASGSKNFSAPDGAMLSADYDLLQELVRELEEPVDVQC